MKKAKYLGRYYQTSWNYKEDIVILEYEYRGMKYEVYENRAKGNEPLAWQHKVEQARIDALLDMPKSNATEDSSVGFEKFFRYCETGEWTD